jgi:5-methyltetrahydrofolate--homocysteine methyltransferase
MITFADFDDSAWARIEHDWTAWWDGTLERPLVTLETHDPLSGVNWSIYSDFLTQFPLGTPPGPLIDHLERRLRATRYFCDAFPKAWLNFGAGIAAAFLGAGASYATNTTWFYPLGVASLADVAVHFDPSNPWWFWVQDIARHAVERWRGRVAIGHTDLGGNLDILASLRGTQDLLTDLYDAPGEVERLTRAITGVWLRFFREESDVLAHGGRGESCWAPHWAPGPMYMLQSDVSYMIGPAMFERYVVPDLEACCAALDYPFYHLDGKGQLKHLDRLLAMPELRGIQWQPGDGQPLADGWLEVLKRIRDAGKLCQVYVRCEGVFTIAHALGGQGFLFSLLEDELTADAAARFEARFRAEFGA